MWVNRPYIECLGIGCLPIPQPTCGFARCALLARIATSTVRGAAVFDNVPFGSEWYHDD